MIAGEFKMFQIFTLFYCFADDTRFAKMKMGRYVGFRSTCGGRWMVHSRRTPAWRSTSVGR